jgi:predicted small metal-binding protein
MDSEIGCECGFVARGGDDNEIVASARAHAHIVHHMDFSAHQLQSLVRPAADDDEPKTMAITKRAEDQQ